MKKRIKFLIIPVIAFIFALGFNLCKTHDSDAYMVNWGDCTPMDIGTIQCSGGEDVTYDGIVKIVVTPSDVEKTIKEYDRYKFINLYMSNSNGEMIDNHRFFVYTNEFLSESGYYSKIAQIVNDKSILYEASSSDKIPQEKKIEVIEYVLDEIFTFDNKLSCSDGYFYSSVAQRCVWNEDVVIPTEYIISDYNTRKLQQWAKGTNLLTHKNSVRDVIFFNLPTDIEWAVDSVNSITVIYNTCTHKTITPGPFYAVSTCDEVSDKQTVTYYDNGTVTITRYDSKKKIDIVPNMGLTQELANTEKNHPNALDSSSKYRRLFKNAKASTLAETYRHYLILNVDDTKYIEMIKVDCTLINGVTSVGNTEGSIVKDEPTEANFLSSLLSSGMGLVTLIILGVVVIGITIVAVIILKPVGKVVSDMSESRKQKSIAKTRKNSKRH